MDSHLLLEEKNMWKVLVTFLSPFTEKKFFSWIIIEVCNLKQNHARFFCPSTVVGRFAFLTLAVPHEPCGH